MPTNPALSRTVSLDALPADVVVHVTQFLLGTDSLRLSLCSRLIYRLLSADAVWTHRLSSSLYPAKTLGLTRQQYCNTTSLFFRGPWTYSGKRTSTGVLCDSAPLPRGLFPRQRDISFDLWFALVQPANDSSTAPAVGVLVGAQDVHASCSDCARPKQSECFAFVDARRDLYCSVLPGKPVVARSLEYHRWYHLALTYDHANHQQSVYLNGSLVHTMEGTTQFPWMQYAQLGAGYLANDEPGSSGRWCGFRGLLDEVRVSYCVWTPTQIQRLAMAKRIHAPMAYTMTRDLGRGDHALSGCWLEVSCTRPIERWLEITACWTPRALTRSVVPHPAARRACSSTAGASNPKRSLWQLLRQCL